MKIRIGLIVGLMIMALSVVGCPEPEVNVDNNGEVINPGDELTLAGNVRISPAGEVFIGTKLSARYTGSETAKVSWQWKKDGRNVGTNSDTYTPTKPGSYTATVSAAGYISKTSAIVTVNDPSLLTLTGTVSITPNSNVTVGMELTANYSGDETVSYQWKQDGANVGDNSSSFTPNEAGSYAVTVSAAGYNSKTSTPVTVKILSPLNGEITITPDTNAVIGMELTAVYDGTETVTLSWQWKQNGTIVGTNSNKFTPIEPGDCTVTVSAAGYHSKTSAPVTVNDPSLLILTGDVSITPNTNVTVGTRLTAHFEGSVNVSYQWKQDGTIVGTNSDRFTPAEPGDYTVTVSAAGYNPKTSAPVTVVIPDLPGTVTISPHTGTIWVGTLLTAEYNGSVTVSYQWKHDGAIVGTNSDTYTPGEGEGGIYTVTVSAPGYNHKTSDPVTVSSLPDLPGNVSISPSSNVTVGTLLTAHYTGTESVSYQWKQNNIEVGTNSNTYTPTGAGTYTVTVSAANYTGKTSAPVNVTAVPELSGTLAISPATSVGVTTGMVLQAVYGGTETSLSYQWKKDGTNVSGATTYKYTPTTVGNYTVTVTSAGSSKTSAAVRVEEAFPGAIAPGTTPEPGFPGFTMADSLYGVSTPLAALAWTTTSSPNLIVNNFADLDKIKNLSGNGSASSPLTIKFSAKFNRDEYILLGVHTTDSDGFITATTDPLRNLFIKLTDAAKYVNLDMSDATFDGYDNDGTLLVNSANSNPTGRGAGATTYLKGIAMPRTMRKIPVNMFRGTTALTTVVLRDCASLLEIGDNAFRGCTNLTALDLHGATKLDHIGKEAFYGITGLRTRTNRSGLDFSSAINLTRINDSSFENNTAEAIYFPASNDMFMGMYACRGMYKVKSLTFYGYALVDAAWGSVPYYTDRGTYNGVFGTGSGTNIFQGNDANMEQRSDHVVEVHVPEALTPLRQYKGYLYLMDDDGYNWGSMHIPNHKTKGDIYRGQTNMLIQARVPNAPAGTVNVYSRNTASDTYKVGTMTNGWVTLTGAPASSNRANLTPVTGMEITIDPRTYHTTANGLRNNSTSDMAVYKTSSAAAPNATTGQHTGGEWSQAVSQVQNWYWNPWIGNPGSNGGYRSNPPTFLQVKSLFYQENNAWKEIRRVGNDTFVNRSHYYDDHYITDKHEIAYVYVSGNVTIKRNARKSASRNFSDVTTFGNSTITGQKYFELGHPNMYNPAYRNEPIEACFYSVHMALKQGWNQIEVLSRYTDANTDDGWDQIAKAVRVSAGIMGPFSTFDANNTEDFSVSAGKAYMMHYDNPVDPPTGPRKYSDEGYQKQVPWVVQ